MWYSRGHQVSNEPVNTRNALSMGTPTAIVPWIAGTVGVLLMTAPVRSRRGRLGGLLKSPERLVPGAVEVGPQGAHSIRVEPVDPARALGPADDQAAVLEHAKVPGHRRPADRELPGQLPHGAGVLSQQLEDRAPGRVTEQTQARTSVSVHERSL